MKRDSVSVYVHMKRDIPIPLYASVNILNEPPSPPSFITLVTNILNGWPISQTKDK